MNCLGTFTAQYFKLLSFDPNTIFQFFVFDDRIFEVKIGTALGRALERRSPELPTLEQARRLVEETRKTKALGLESPVKSREISLAEIESAELRKTGLSREKLQFRFLEPSEEAAAVSLLERIRVLVPKG